MEKVKYDVDVLIIGAGPSGLMMACQLLMHNITFRIIDKKDAPAMNSGALILHARTLEILDELGLAKKAIEAGSIVQSICISFNSPKITSIDISKAGFGLTRFPFFLMIEQWRTENLLIDFMKARSCNLESSTELVSFTNNNDFVTSEVSTASGEIKEIKSRFLIGADGTNSIVRQKLGIPFPGKTHQQRLFITDCEVKLPIPGKEILFSFTDSYTLGCFPLGGNSWRIDGLIPSIQQKDNASFEDVKYFFDSNQDYGIKLQNPQWFSVFKSHSRCAESFRKKQCFLVGDAAHVHSPVGAQGMNTGMQDSYNLAFTLALYMQGKGTDDLLDIYEKERRPIALTNIRYTDFAYFLLTSGSLIAKISRQYLFPLVLPFFKGRLEKKTLIQTYLFKALSGIGSKKRGLTDSPASVRKVLTNHFNNT